MDVVTFTGKEGGTLKIGGDTSSNFILEEVNRDNCTSLFMPSPPRLPTGINSMSGAVSGQSFLSIAKPQVVTYQILVKPSCSGLLSRINLLSFLTTGVIEATHEFDGYQFHTYNGFLVDNPSIEFGTPNTYTRISFTIQYGEPFTVSSMATTFGNDSTRVLRLRNMEVTRYATVTIVNSSHQSTFYVTMPNVAPPTGSVMGILGAYHVYCYDSSYSYIGVIPVKSSGVPFFKLGGSVYATTHNGGGTSVNSYPCVV